jgi:hypothetical protein
MPGRILRHIAIVHEPFRYGGLEENHGPGKHAVESLTSGPKLMSNIGPKGQRATFYPGKAERLTDLSACQGVFDAVVDVRD